MSYTFADIMNVSLVLRIEGSSEMYGKSQRMLTQLGIPTQKAHMHLNRIREPTVEGHGKKRGVIYIYFFQKCTYQVSLL